MNHHQKTPSDAGAASRKRSIAKWILFAILILPW